MTIKKLTLLIIIATCLVLHFYSCKKDPKCDGPSYAYLAFDKKDTTLLPYTGYDTLYFQYKVNNQIIDTFTFVGTGKKRGKEDLFPGGTPDESCRPTVEGETMDIKYNSIDTNLFMTFSWRIDNVGVSKSLAKIGINFNAKDFFLGASNDFDGSYGYLYPSINLNGSEYYNAGIMFKGSTLYDINTSDKKNISILNPEFGLLQLMLDSTVFWNRIDK